MSGAIPPFPNTPSWRGAQLKHRDSFTFTFTLGLNIVLISGMLPLPCSTQKEQKKQGTRKLHRASKMKRVHIYVNKN
jgi:hypothetical protein